MSSEGYDVECVREESNDFFCIICLKLMRNAIQTNCGHVMCGSCLDGLVASYHQRNTDVVCPSCRSVVNVNAVTQVPMLDRLIMSLKVKCQSFMDGCEWTGELSLLETHKRNCDYRLVSCSIPECEELIQQCKIQQHLNNSCKFMKRLCAFKEFGCCETVFCEDRELHEGDLVHVKLLQKILQEKDDLIDQLRRENDELKQKLFSVEEMKEKFEEFENKLNSAVAQMTQEKSRNPTDALSHQEPSKEPSVDEAFILDYNLVSDPNDDILIHQSLQNLYFRDFAFHGKSYERGAFIDRIFEIFNSVLAKSEFTFKDFFQESMKVHVRHAKMSIVSLPDYWKNSNEIITKALVSKHLSRLLITNTCLSQLRFISSNEITYPSGTVLKTKRCVYVVVKWYSQCSNTFEHEGVKNTVYQLRDGIAVQVYSAREVAICHLTDMFLFHPTKLIEERMIEDKYYKIFQSHYNIHQLTDIFVKANDRGLRSFRYSFILRIRF